MPAPFSDQLIRRADSLSLRQDVTSLPQRHHAPSLVK